MQHSQNLLKSFFCVKHVSFLPSQASVSDPQNRVELACIMASGGILPFALTTKERETLSENPDRTESSLISPQLLPWSNQAADFQHLASVGGTTVYLLVPGGLPKFLAVPVALVRLYEPHLSPTP